MPPPPPPEKPAETKVQPPETPPPPSVSPAPAGGEKPIEAASEESTKVDTPLYVAEISNVGGVLKSFQLKKYTDSAGKPTELVDGYTGRQVGFPLAMRTEDEALNKILSEARYVLTQEGLKVTLEYHAGGLHARKILDFDPDKYKAVISTIVERNGAAIPHDLVLQGEFGDQSHADIATSRSAVYYAGGKFQRMVVSSVSDPQEVPGSLVGVEDQYFIAMFIRDKEGPIKLSKQEYKLPDLADGTKGADALGLSVAVPSTAPMTLYLGPKLEESLVQVDPRNLDCEVLLPDDASARLRELLPNAWLEQLLVQKRA